jgi:MscS family membrane protein
MEHQVRGEAGLDNFWQLVKSVWNDGIMGVDIGNILIAFGIFAGFLLIRGLFTLIILHQINFWTRKTETTIDDLLVDALAPPIRFIPVVMGLFFAGEYLGTSGISEIIMLSLNRSLIAFVIFWALYRLIIPLSDLLRSSRGIFTTAMVEWFVKALKLIVILIGGAAILEIWGIEVVPLIAGLGLFGVAVALGAQDLFKNLIAGLFVIGERRFHTGDWIKVEGQLEGVVEQIGFRTTKIRRFDKAPVYVPNSILSDNVVTNFSEMTHRRIKWLIGIEYRSSVNQLRHIRNAIEAHLAENEDFAKAHEVSTFVHVDHFSDSSINILLYCFTRTVDWGEWLEIKESLALTIKEIVEGAGCAFAFPSRSIYVESVPGDSTEDTEIFPLSKKTPDK